MNRYRKKSREQICRIFYERKLSDWPFRTRRGLQYKRCSLTKYEAKDLKRAKAENGERFYKTKVEWLKDWEGVITHKDETLLVKVTIAAYGSSFMMVTKEPKSPTTSP